MAEMVANLNRSSEMFIQTSEEFEKDLKTSLKWNKQYWNQMGMAGTRKNKLCNSLNFWKEKLKPALEDKSFVITIFNVVKDVKTDLLDIITAIEDIDSKIKVKGFSSFRNPRYLCFYFDTKEDRNYIMEKFRIYNESYVVYLSWALGLETNVTTLKVHWLPMTVDLDLIKKELLKYVSCIEAERISLSFMSGRNMPSGKVTFTVSIHEGVTKEEIPHIMNIAKMEALITIPGRKPLCLNCDILGHVSKDCRLRFCAKCSTLKERDHQCAQEHDGKTYAGILKSKGFSEKVTDLDDWNAAFETDKFKIKTMDAQEVIAEKINNIESQIKDLNSDCSSVSDVKPDMKRKAEFMGPLLASGSSVEDLQHEASGVDVSNEVIFSDSGVSESDEDSEIKPMNVDAPESTNCAVQKERKKARGRRKNKVIKEKKAAKEDSDNLKGENNVNILRSYGKPILNNDRRMREEAKFDKLIGKQEFVFKD